MISTLLEGRGAYLFHLFFWSLPVFALQGFFLLRWYRGELRRVARAVLPPVLLVTAWLVVIDHLAFDDGIWWLGEGRHLGWRLGAVPIEEILFFSVTNLLVGFGLALAARFRLPAARPRSE